MSTDPKSSADIASAWLAKFGVAVSAGDAQAATAMFLGFGWLRDVLVLTWTHRSRCGHHDISSYFADHLHKAQITNVKLDEDNGISPAMIPTPALMVEAALTFDTPIVHGRGLIRLLQDQSGEWKALSVFLMAMDLRGHEEKGCDSGYYDGHTKTWNEVHMEQVAQIESDPHVLIGKLPAVFRGAAPGISWCDSRRGAERLKRWRAVPPDGDPRAVNRADGQSGRHLAEAVPHAYIAHAEHASFL